MRKIDLIGKQFGRWLVLSEAGKSKLGQIHWLCRCDCGAEKTVQGRSLRYGESKSCGCLHRELSSKEHRGKIISKKHRKKVSEAKTTHGLSKTKVYLNMKEQKRRAMKLNQSPKLTQEEQHRIEILYKWGQLFGWHIDHIKPISKGGLHHPDNLQLISIKQNKSKYNKDPKEFYGRFYEFLCKGD